MAESTPPPAEPARPIQPAVPQSPPASVADRLRRPSRAPWIIAGAVVAVIALVVTGVWLWVAATPQSAPAIEIEEFAEAPVIGRWTLQTPVAPLAAADVCEAGQDAALVILRDVAGHPDAVSLVDTASGEVAWTTSLPSGYVAAACAAASLERSAAAISTVDAQRRSGLLAIDLEDGVLSRPSGHLELLAAPESLDGDLVASTGTTVGRFDLVGLEPVWTVRSSGASVAVGGGVLVLDAEVLSLATGTPMPWTAAAGAYGSVDGALLRVDRDGALATVTAVDGATGGDRWSRELGDGAAVPVPGSGLLLAVDPAAGTVTAVRVSDGGEQWSIDAALDPDPGAITGSASAGIVLLPITGDASTVSVVDLATGEVRFDLEIGDPADPSTAVALTPTTITMAQPGGTSLTAIDADTGDRRWRLEPDAPGGTFAEVGGRFLLVGAAAILGIGEAPADR